MESRCNVEVMMCVEVQFRNFQTKIFVKPIHTIADMKKLVLVHPHHQAFAGAGAKRIEAMKSLLKNSRIYQNGVACADYALVADLGAEGCKFTMIMKDPDAPVISEITPIKSFQEESELDQVIIASLEEAKWTSPLNYFKSINKKKKAKKADEIENL